MKPEVEGVRNWGRAVCGSPESPTIARSNNEKLSLEERRKVHPYRESLRR